MALGKAPPILVDGKLTVKPFGPGVAESTVEENLTSCGFQEVGSANDLRYPHGKVVRDACELIAWKTIPTPDEKVAEIDAGYEALRAEVGIMEFDSFAIRNAEPKVEPAGCIRESG